MPQLGEQGTHDGVRARCRGIRRVARRAADEHEPGAECRGGIGDRARDGHGVADRSSLRRVGPVELMVGDRRHPAQQ
jgi:hypothetical protein